MLALVVVACIVVVAIAGFFSWRRFQASPEYSLALLVDAAQRNDQEQIANLIDDDEVAKNMIAAVSQKAIERYGGTMNATTQQQIDKLMPSLLPRVKQAVHDELANQFTVVSSSAPRPFYALLLAIRSHAKITTEGDTARATLDMAPNVEMMMQRDSDHWKVVAINDDSLVQHVVDSLMKNLPPIGAFDSDNPLLKNPGKSRKKRK